VSVFLGRRKPGSSYLPSDAIAAMAWVSYLDSLCPGCGQPRHESFAAENDGAYAAEADRCHACTAVAVAAKAWAAADKAVEGGHDGSAGRYFSTELRVRK